MAVALCWLHVAPRVVIVCRCNRRLTYRFTRQQRLLKTDEFSSVFSLRRTQSNAWFQVWSKPNSLGQARVGVVVAKKIVKRAVGRNRIKRLVRETFRLHAAELQALDLIIRAKQPVCRAKAGEARAALLRLLDRYRPCPAS
ncbi:ribonuclease P protein component [Chitinimonas sp.]|uniref:ribonuclease P protein component n=1 Tax=Chitinimonas sp. TaxID=1934313 RepID=UPI0035B344FA